MPLLVGLSAVHQFISVGDHAMVSGGSLLRKDVPPYTKAAKEPLSYVGINSVGLRRRGFTSEKIREIQEIYRILYQKNYNVTQAIDIIEAEMEATPERDEIIRFYSKLIKRCNERLFRKLLNKSSIVNLFNRLGEKQINGLTIKQNIK